MLVRRDKYLAGQKWSYKTQKRQENTSVLILKVEILDGVDVVHLTVVSDNILFEAPTHMPFSKSAVDKSIISILSENNRLPDFKNGYDYWKKHYLDGEAGIYRISVAEALNL